MKVSIPRQSQLVTDLHARQRIGQRSAPGLASRAGGRPARGEPLEPGFELRDVGVQVRFPQRELLLGECLGAATETPAKRQRLSRASSNFSFSMSAACSRICASRASIAARARATSAA